MEGTKSGLKFEINIPHNILIKPSCNGGFVCEIGCALRIYEDADTMIADLKKYLDDPDAADLAYHKAVNDRHANPAHPSTRASDIEVAR